MSTESHQADGLGVLDDALAALALLRRQASHGELGAEELNQIVELIRGQLLGNALIQGVLGGTPVAAPAPKSPEPAAPVPTPEPVAPQPEAPQPEANPAASATDAPPPDEAEDAGEPSPHAEAEGLISKLSGVRGSAEGLGVHLPAKAADFLSKSGKALHAIPEDEQKGQKLAQVLYQGVGILDQVEQANCWSRHRDALRSIVDPVRSAVAEFLAREHGLGFVPEVGLDRVSKEAAPEGVDVTWMRAPGPVGAVLWTASRAYSSGGSVQGRGRVVCADEGSTELRAWLIEAWKAIESDRAGDPRSDLDKLSRYIEELEDGEERSEANTARHALNLLHSRNGSGQHANPMKWLYAFLGKHGIYEIPVPVGKQFDSSFSPNKFERKREHSSQPSGTILRVVSPGLVDRDGLPLQKAVIAVSTGSS